MDISSNIGRKVRACRKQKGFSQAKLAELVERSVEAISHIERGVSLPTIETLVRLSDKLDTPLTHFLDLDPNNQNSNWRTDRLAEVQAIANDLSDKNLEVAANLLRALIQKDH